MVHKINIEVIKKDKIHYESQFAFSKHLSVLWSDSRLLLPQGEPHTLLTAGRGVHTRGLLVLRLLQTRPQGVVDAGCK